MILRSPFVLASPLVLVLLLGCGPAKTLPGSLSGKVTYKGSPVTGGALILHAKEGAVFSAVINPDGTYAVSDLPAGDMTATIETEALNPANETPVYGQPGSGGTYTPPSGGAQTTPNPGKYVKIPAKYTDPKTSGLTVTVTNGAGHKDFDLTD